MRKKLKRCVRCGREKYIKAHGLCSSCYQVLYYTWVSEKRPTRTFKEFALNYNKQQEIKKTVKRKPRSKRQKAIKLADQWFSRFIRTKYAFKGSDGKLYAKCYTCGRMKEIKKLDNGHFLSRQYMITRYHPNNARPQCKRCNMYRQGEVEKFEVRLRHDLGNDYVDALKAKVRSDVKLSTYEIQNFADYYKKETRKLEKKLGVTYW